MTTQYKPILFSTEMVQAILEGRKTQTRRILKPQPDFNIAWKNLGFSENKFGIKTELEIPDIDVTGNFLGVSSPIEIDGFKATGLCIPNIPIKIHKGDILWVRETFQKFNNKEGFAYYASENSATQNLVSWKPSIHMPKEAARIFLEVTNVRVERLQDITEEDVIAEGVKMIKKGEKYEDLENGELISKKHEENYYYFYPGHDDFRDDSYMPRSVFPNAHISSFFSLWCLIHNEKSWNANPWVWVYEFKKVEKPTLWPQ